MLLLYLTIIFFHKIFHVYVKLYLHICCSHKQKLDKSIRLLLIITLNQWVIDKVEIMFQINWTQKLNVCCFHMLLLWRLWLEAVCFLLWNLSVSLSVWVRQWGGMEPPPTDRQSAGTELELLTDQTRSQTRFTPDSPLIRIERILRVGAF